MAETLMQAALPDLIRIRMLGGFRMTVGNTVISDAANHSQQMWNLLEYLIAFRNKAISQEELIAALWTDDDSENPTNALKNLIYRIRTTFANSGIPHAKELICCRRGTYSWNNAINCEVDIEQFEALCASASNTAFSAGARVDYYLKAFGLYGGDFLPNSCYREWVIPLTNYYHNLYFKSVYDSIDLLVLEERYLDIQKVCERAIIIDQFEERAHKYLIYSLVRQGKQSQALAHYNYVTDLFYRELGVSLSEGMRSLYREIVKTVNSIETDLGIIKEDLGEQERAQGAFYCEYEIFKCMYRVEARTASRTGQAIFVALLTLTDQDDQVPEVGRLGKAMDQLLLSVRASLRKGDIISRFSATQYVLMLPTLTFENGQMVLSRIAKRFKAEFRGRDIKLHTTLQPLDPVE